MKTVSPIHEEDEKKVDNPLLMQPSLLDAASVSTTHTTEEPVKVRGGGSDD